MRQSKILYQSVVDCSEMYLSPEQQEVSDTLSSAAGRMVQGQLKEGESEAPGEAEVTDGTQRPEAREMSHLTVRQVPSRPQRSASFTCNDRWREENWGTSNVSQTAKTCCSDGITCVVLMNSSGWRGGFTGDTWNSPVSVLFPAIGSWRRGPRSRRGRWQRRRRKWYCGKGGFIENLPSPRCHGAVWEEFGGRSGMSPGGRGRWRCCLISAASAVRLMDCRWGERRFCCGERRMKWTEVNIWLHVQMCVASWTFFWLRSCSPLFGAYLFFDSAMTQWQAASLVASLIRRPNSRNQNATSQVPSQFEY